MANRFARRKGAKAESEDKAYLLTVNLNVEHAGSGKK